MDPDDQQGLIARSAVQQKKIGEKTRRRSEAKPEATQSPLRIRKLTVVLLCFCVLVVLFSVCLAFGCSLASHCLTLMPKPSGEKNQIRSFQRNFNGQLRMSSTSSLGSSVSMPTLFQGKTSFTK